MTLKLAALAAVRVAVALKSCGVPLITTRQKPGKMTAFSGC